MPANRYFIDEHFEKGKSVTLRGEEWEHARRVMRKKSGESIELLNGRFFLAQGIVKESTPSHGTIQLTHLVQSPSPTFRCVLRQSFLRYPSLALLVEKSTELGADEIALFPAQYSEKKHYSLQEQSRLRKKMIAAMKQCGRTDLPRLSFLPPVEEWETERDALLFYGVVDEKKGYRGIAIDKEWRDCSRYVFVTGPEKGFSKNEKRLLSKMGKQLQWHPNILRAETAPLAFLAFIHGMRGKNN